MLYFSSHIHNAGQVRGLELYTFKILFLAVEVIDVDITNPLKNQYSQKMCMINIYF